MIASHRRKLNPFFISCTLYTFVKHWARATYKTNVKVKVCSRIVLDKGVTKTKCEPKATMINSRDIIIDTLEQQLSFSRLSKDSEKPRGLKSETGLQTQSSGVGC